VIDIALGAISTPEFDYVYLKWLLRDQAAPRDKITALLKSGRIVRVKKGLYVLGPVFNRPYSRLVLANLIYGPSYVSGISALAHWGLIPERTELVSSATPSRNKSFTTPVGRFQYKFVAMSKYAVSVVSQRIDASRTFLVATPEKAVVETLITSPEHGGTDIRQWLELMRIEAEQWTKLRLTELKSLEVAYKDSRISALMALIKGARADARSR
jgi:predicted transcriptional regulator of viral defense system